MSVGGLSIANNLLANNVSLNLNRNQEALKTTVTQLSSGLRINTAADDPSGLAIAEKLQAQVNGFDQAVKNVQDANNAATIAEGALQTTTDILQRIRSLAVEASSDITSPTDKTNLQAEVSQLLLEVNRISQNTNFNGSALLDGSHAGFQPQQNAFLDITSNAALASGATNGTFNGATGLNTALLVVSASAADSSFTTTPGGAGNTLTGPQIGGVTYTAGTGDSAPAPTVGATVDGTIELQVINTGTSIAVRETFFDSTSSSQNPATISTTLYGANEISSYFDNVSIKLGNFTTADVGVTTYIKVSQNVAALSNPNAPAFNFQSGAAEGSTIQVGFQATNTTTLRISNVNLLLSTSSSPSLGSEDAIGQIDNALERLLNQRAQLGAVIVRLNEDANNDNVASVNLQASESQIRDLNVGAATTQFTKLQILVQVGTSVLAQSNSNAQSVLGLFR